MTKNENSQSENQSSKLKAKDGGLIKWKNRSALQKAKLVLISIIKLTLLLGFLYLFICSIVLVAESLNLLVGRIVVDVFTSSVFLSNPVTGLIIGILVTVIVQSSSTSTSVVIAMVAARVITVEKGIPIVMGANIGTSVTNTAVSMTLVGNQEQFRKAFAGATVHDCFNFLSALVLLPVEAAFGYLEALSKAVINSLGKIEGTGAPRFLRTLTAPVVDNLIHVNLTVQRKSAMGEYLEPGNSLIAIWCERRKSLHNFTTVQNETFNLSENFTTTALSQIQGSNVTNATVNRVETVYVGVRPCDRSDFLFANTGLSESAVGGILFALSLILLIGCLWGMVKVLTSSLKGSLKKGLRKAVDTNFPKPFGWLSGYVAVLVGCGVTMLIQSSSVVTSTLTPLVGLGVVKLKRMYAVTVGANMGTTTTAVLAALATSNSNSLQLAFCHFFFNLSGFLLWYPIPFMRKIPIKAATRLGNITAKYRWFSIFYIISVFFVLPLIILGLSFAPFWLLGTVLAITVTVVLFVIVINVLQQKRPNCLPKILKSWDFLPVFLHSLKPMDRLVMKSCGWCHVCRCCYSNHNAETYVNHECIDIPEVPMRDLQLSVHPLPKSDGAK